MSVAVPCWWQDDLCDGDWTCGATWIRALSTLRTPVRTTPIMTQMETEFAATWAYVRPTPTMMMTPTWYSDRILTTTLSSSDIDTATPPCALGKYEFLLLVWIAGSVVLLAGRTADTMLAFAQQRAVFSEENDVCPPSIAASPNKILKQQAAEFLAADIPSLEARATTISTEHTPALTPVSSSATAAA